MALSTGRYIVLNPPCSTSPVHAITAVAILEHTDTLCFQVVGRFRCGRMIYLWFLIVRRF